MKLLALIFCLFALSSATTINVGIVPVGKELVFNYEAIVHTGTKQPALYESEYKLKANLRLQGLKEDLIGVKLTDVVYTLNNGPINPDQIIKTTYLPIPTEAELLKIPFQIQYNANGQVVALILDQTDKEWSINIKQSIASLLQIDRQVIDIERKTGYIAVVPEETVYGVCDVNYEVLPRENSFILIKTQEPAKCKNHFNLERHSSILSVVSNRAYNLTNKDNHLHIETVESRGDLLMYNPAVNGLTDYLHTIQYLKFVEEVSITEEIQINNKVIVKSLKYTEPHMKCRDMPLNNIYDFTNGRRVLNAQMEIKHVHDFLDELVNYIDSQQVTFEQPEIKNVQLVARILRILETFNLPTLEQCFLMLQEKSIVTPRELRKLNLFLQMLPHIGSRPAVILIRNLIRKQKIDNYLAVRIVRDLPNHIQCPNEKLLTEIEDLLEMGEENSMLRRTCVLSFATLIKKTFQNIDEKSTVLEQYINRFIDKLKTSQDYGTKVLALESLSNIGIGSVLRQLEPIIKGEVEVEGNLRSLAILAAAPRLIKDPMLMMKMLLPIVSDYRLDTDLRVTAYYVYVKTEQPTLARFMKLHWMLRDDPNGKLYNFHYNTLVTFTQATGFEKSNLRDICRMLLRISPRPVTIIPSEGFHIHEYYDTENKFGARAESFLIQTNRGMTMKSKIRTKYAGYDFDFLTIYMRLVDQNKNVIPLDTRRQTLNRPNILSNKKYSVELIIRRGDRTELLFIENNINMMQIFKTLAALDLIHGDDKVQNRIQLSVPIYYDLIVPTDLGVPARLSESLSLIHLIKFNFDTNGVMKIDLKLKGMGTRTVQTKVYNPIVDLWHGIQTVRGLTMNLPLNLVMEKSQGWGVKITMKKVTTDGIIGLQDYVQSEVFIQGYQNQQLLSNFRQDVAIYEPVTRGQNYKQKIVVHQSRIDAIGKNLEVVIFDCDRDLSRGTLLTKIKEIERRRDLSDFSPALELVRIQQYLFLSPGIGNCGIGVRLLPSQNVDQMEMSVELINENQKQDENLFLNPIKASVRAHIIAKSAQNTEMYKYDSDVSFELGDLYRNILFNYSMSKKDSGVEKYKMNIDINGKLNEDSMDVVAKIVLGYVNNLGVVDVVVKGLYSEEQERIQREKNIIYNECRPEYIGGEILPISLECFKKASTLRKYLIDISVNDKENQWVKNVLKMLQVWRLRFRDFIEHEEINENNIETGHEGHIHIETVLPAFRNEWDVQVKTPKMIQMYKGVPRKWDDWFLRLAHPTNLFFFNEMIDSLLFSLRDAKTCVIGPKYMMTDQTHIIHHVMTTEYTPYLKGLTSEGEAYTVFLKKVDGTKPIAIRIKVQDEVLEFVPENDDCTVIYNGEVMTKNWSKYIKVSPTFQYFITPHPKAALIRANLYGLHVAFDGKYARLYAPTPFVQKLEGKCIEY